MNHLARTQRDLLYVLAGAGDTLTTRELIQHLRNRYSNSISKSTVHRKLNSLGDSPYVDVHTTSRPNEPRRYEPTEKAYQAISDFHDWITTESDTQIPIDHPSLATLSEDLCLLELYLLYLIKTTNHKTTTSLGAKLEETFELSISRATLYRLINNLETDNYVTEQQSGAAVMPNPVAKRYTVTKAGQQLLEKHTTVEIDSVDHPTA